MSFVLSAFKAVSLIFAAASVATGVQAIADPVGFSKVFGLPITSNENQKSYVSLMGVRQIATGVILMTFAYQGMWTEMATILAIIGILIAGTDGIYLSRGGGMNAGIFHALPGALISALALRVIWSGA